MAKNYINGLLKRSKTVKEYRDTTDSKDYTFLSHLDNLLGYIDALKDKNIELIELKGHKDGDINV